MPPELVTSGPYRQPRRERAVDALEPGERQVTIGPRVDVDDDERVRHPSANVRVRPASPTSSGLLEVRRAVEVSVSGQRHLAAAREHRPAGGSELEGSRAEFAHHGAHVQPSGPTSHGNKSYR